MKKISLILFAFLLVGRVRAGEAAWLTSLPQAAAQASREGKLLLLDFTGSDWCGWCMRLEAETFSKPEFIGYASKNLVLVRVDFPRRTPQSDDLKEANRALKDKYSVSGYPTVLILKPNGDELWEQPGYVPGGPRVMIDAANQCRKAAGLAPPAEPDAPAIAATPPAAPVAVVSIPPPAPPPRKPGDEPKLQGILYSASHSSAVLDGHTCEEGDTVSGVRVLKIEHDTVTVESQGHIKVLSMN